ncbi:MAG: DUF1653 domain-containing protein [Lachnospiraceae bacterium]|nr:DUF1653 domain-containing protein [Lachnospiraceae bacterium]
METIQIGKIYRHFKGGIYQVLCTATHTEINEKLVIYQALYGSFNVFARPVSQFTEEVPDSKENVTKQRYRFEEVKDVESVNVSAGNINTVPSSGDSGKKAEAEGSVDHTGNDIGSDMAEDTTESTAEDKDMAGVPSPVIMQFLDAGSSKEKLDIIKANYSKIDERTITNIEVSLDIISSSDDIDQRIGYVCDVLSTRSRFEDSRLR